MISIDIPWEIHEKEDTHQIIWWDLFQQDSEVLFRFLSRLLDTQQQAGDWINHNQIDVSLRGEVNADLFFNCVTCERVRVVVEVKGPQAKFNWPVGPKGKRIPQTKFYRDQYVTGPKRKRLKGCSCSKTADLPKFVILDARSRPKKKLQEAAEDEILGWATVGYKDVLAGKHMGVDQSGRRSYLLGVPTTENGAL